MPSLAHLVQAGHQFRRRLDSLKRNRPEIAWYPYGTLGLMDVLPKLLTPPWDTLFDQLGDGRIADLGCSDGDLSFFLESQGFPIEARDHPHVNHSLLAGFQAMHRELESKVAFSPIDLDHPVLGPRQIDLAIMLGVLYHLKNPVTILEQLAARSRYLLTSTRVMRRAPDGRDLTGLPVAWYLDEAETNNDSTNYWILTQAALELLLKRAGWEILRLHNHGVVEDSEPIREDRDERVYVLARSRHFQFDTGELTHGWYAREPGPFRWTAPKFGFRVDRPAGRKLELDLFVPDALGSLSLSGTVNGVKLPSHSFAPGNQVYRAEIDQPAPWVVEMETGQAHHRDGVDYGVVVPFANCPVRTTP